MKARIAVVLFAVADAVMIGLGVFLYQGEDRTAPVISFEETNDFYREGMEESELLAGVSAADDRDGDVTASLIVEKVSETADGNVIVTYVAVDSANNVAKRSREYRVR